MANTNAYAAFEKIRHPDGSYSIVFPINTSEEVYVDISNKVTLTNKLASMDAGSANDKETIVEDIISLMNILSPMFPKPVLLNHVFADDFGDNSVISVSKGMKVPGQVII